jgi:hypothetical protein
MVQSDDTCIPRWNLNPNQPLTLHLELHHVHMIIPETPTEIHKERAERVYNGRVRLDFTPYLNHDKSQSLRNFIASHARPSTPLVLDSSCSLSRQTLLLSNNPPDNEMDDLTQMLPAANPSALSGALGISMAAPPEALSTPAAPLCTSSTPSTGYLHELINRQPDLEDEDTHMSDSFEVPPEDMAMDEHGKYLVMYQVCREINNLQLVIADDLDVMDVQRYLSAEIDCDNGPCWNQTKEVDQWVVGGIPTKNWNIDHSTWSDCCRE